MTLFFIYPIIFLLSAWLTGSIRRYALSTNIIDIPNERSSHVVPTPRGGGLGFVLTFMLSLFVFAYWQVLDLSQAMVYCGSGSLIALLGFMDDRYGLAIKWRLLSHFIVVAYALSIIGNLSAIAIGPWVLAPGPVLSCLSFFYLVWLLNLFNFMDGIDGLAASEAIFSCLSMSFIYYYQAEPNAFYLPLSLALVTAGFLLWNFPPAKIFMGDIGSCFLGLIIGLFSLYALELKVVYFWSWLILLAVFIVDASFTLARRILKREAFWRAHRTHAYQHAAIHYGNHRSVTLGVLLINLFWLFPLAFLVAIGSLSPLSTLMIAYLPLLILAFWFEAGAG